MSNYSQERLEARIKESIGILISTRQIKTFGINSLVSVTQVELAKDMTSCNVYISGPLDDETLSHTRRALESSKGFIQKKLAGNLKMRNTPVLHFKIDKEGDKASKLDEIFRKIEEEAGSDSASSS